MQVLLVEDDPDLAELVIEYLEDESIECDLAYHGDMALQLIHQNVYDVVVTDIMLPGISGLAFCQKIRQQGYNQPVLMLTARDRLEDKLDGFAHGADDYLVKPFDLAELTVRIQVLARRKLMQSSLLQVADLQLDTKSGEVKRRGQRVNVGPAEVRLLECLLRRSPDVVSRQEIERWVWPDAYPSDDAYKMLAYRLRKQLNQEGLPVLLHTFRGKGLAIRVIESNGKAL